MLIIISPAKSLDFETDLPEGVSPTQPIYEKQADYLVSKLKTFSAKKLSKMMDISATLAELNTERYQAYESLDKAATRPAVFAFDGDVYKGLSPALWDDDTLDLAQERLRILSGLYGVLRPLDSMKPYRLEMGTDWAITPSKKNLYAYWKKTVTDTVLNHLKSFQSEFMLNLASQEYSKVIDFKKIPVRVVTPEFREERNGEFQMISFFAKRARGLMTTFALEKNITKPAELLHFGMEGYGFNERLSNLNQNKWVFTRKSSTIHEN